MSLHTLAHHLQSAGRGKDSVLVHMTPAEVGGLQKLAMAHGGSLTVNPETGLPEAGFLSSLLPMLAGGALTVLSGGALTPLMAAGIVGGGTALATGSLSKGLMAGLGAYGGAGIGTGLGVAGTDAAAAQAVQGMTNSSTGALASGVTPEAYATAAQQAATTAAASPGATAMQGLQSLGTSGGRAAFMGGLNATPYAGTAALSSGMSMATPEMPSGMNKKSASLIRPYEYTKEINPDAGAPRGNVWEGPVSSGERDYFIEKMTPLQPYWAPGPEYDKKKSKSTGTSIPMPGMYSPPGQQTDPITGQKIDPLTGRPINPYTGQPSYAVGGPVEQMSAENAVGANMMYPQSQLNTSMYSNPMMQRPTPENMITQGLNTPVDPYTGQQKLAAGGISTLGDYSDGGRLLKGPGDGVSDSIPAVIGNRQPARLADGEFVVPARIVSELGNGSTEAGAKRLYAMMERIQHARRKTVGKGRIAKDTNAEKYLPA